MYHILIMQDFCTQENWTALMAASRRGHYEAVDILLQYGADPNMQDHV